MNSKEIEKIRYVIERSQWTTDDIEYKEQDNYDIPI